MRDNLLFFAFAGLAIAGVVLMRERRGIRNNNPGNIEYHPANNWNGQTGSDGRYAIFSDPVYGIRALAKLLRNYQSRHGLTTTRQIITRWAPPNENATESYIQSVVAQTQYPADMFIDLNGSPRLTALVKAIIQHENGKQPYTDAQISQGISMAL